MRLVRACLVLGSVVPLLATASLCGAALSADLETRDVERLERELEAEFTRLHERVLTPATSASARDAWQNVEQRLHAILTRVQAADTGMGGLAFGGPGMQNDEWAAELRGGLQARAAVLAELSAVLDELAEHAGAVREPFDPERIAVRPRAPSDSLGALRSAANLLCGQAWSLAREPAGGGESARALTRVLTLAQVTDDGPGFAFGMRVALENMALECAARLVDEGRIDPDDLRSQLVRGLPRDRLRTALECALLQLEWCFRTGRDERGRPIEAGRRAEALLALQEAVRERVQLLDSEPDARWREFSGERVDGDPHLVRHELTFLARGMQSREDHIARLFPGGL